ncbi:MAG: sigma-70 family RNA polymerase sigma factor [Bacteroidota bacterium]
MQEASHNLIGRIKSGDRQALHDVYLEHKRSFIDWAGASFRCSEPDAEDIWQEVIIVFYENIIEGKLTSLKSQVRTYLFGIGRFMLLRKYEQQKRWTELPEQEDGPEIWVEQAVSEYEMELNDRQRMLLRQLEKLGENCQKLLRLFYYRRYSTESIMMEMGYKSTEVAKSQKARCMRNLRKNMEAIKNQL